MEVPSPRKRCTPQTSLEGVRCVLLLSGLCVLCVQVVNGDSDSCNMEDTLRTSVVESSHVSDSESTLREVTQQLRE